MALRTIFISIISIISINSYTQEIFTLEKCKELALKNNVSGLNQEISLAAAKETKKEAFTKYFPSVSAVGIGFVNSEPMIEMASEYGTYGMLEKGMVGAITASMPLFAGGQIVNGNKLAQKGVEVSRLQKTISDDEIKITVEQYYWQIVSLSEKMKTINEAEALLNRIYEDVNNAYIAGMINKNDLLKVELKQNELESNKLKVSNGIIICKMVLAQYIGVPENNFDIDSENIEIIMSPADAFVNHQTALLNRAEFQLLDKNIEVNKLQLKMKMGENLPTIAVGASYNFMGFDQGALTSSNKNFGMAFATISIPISGWWGGSHAIKKQKMNVRMAENTKRDSEEKLLIQMQQLQNELGEGWFQIQLADKAIASALENVRLNEDCYKAGTSLLSDLLDAQSALQQCRDQRTEAVTNYRIRLSNYLQSTGQKNR